MNLALSIVKDKKQVESLCRKFKTAMTHLRTCLITQTWITQRGTQNQEAFIKGDLQRDRRHNRVRYGHR